MIRTARFWRRPRNVNDTPPQQESILIRLAIIITTGFVHFLTLLLVMAELCLVVPKFVEFFHYQDVLLPAWTIQVMDLSMFVINYYYLAFFILLIDGSIVIWLSAPKKRWLLSIYSQAWLLLVCIFIFWVGVVMLVPVYNVVPADWSPT